ncbi:MAG: glycosyl transferase family 1 [Stigonema ocellatum SAG 48.90 = DSM 106950]|nr:glycosyl transferase family 1 [Stigonema ocellatum SAG 48.90 = DSM 106950]
MTHFGIICPAATGHLNPITALGRELQRRGHRVTVVGVLDAQSKALEAGLEFRAIAESESPLGTVAESFAQLGKMNGLAAFSYTVSLFKTATALLLRDAPSVIKEAGIEALLVDESTSAGGTVAEFLQIPFVTVCCALVLYQENNIPPFFATWSYNTAWWARLRNQVGLSLLRRIAQPIRDVIAEYRRQWNLPLYSSSNQMYSKLAILSQQPAEFEFPRQHLPECFHFTGSYQDSTGRLAVDFPFEQLTGQPLIYASMGTVQNRLQYVFPSIAEACVGLDVQLVISLGGALEPEALPKLPGEPLVVKYAPQLELLKKTTLTITHAGLNTALESLSNGVPMVAIPIANDQPGVAARIAWTGTGEFVPLSGLSVPKLREAIELVIREPVPFPFEKLTLAPLIYASMGTIQNRLMDIFHHIAEACVGLDVQLVISLGSGISPESLPKLPGSPLVVGYAPQLELLKKATLTITHAGLNTTLESLSNGVPLVAIPIATDQPGVAARIAWTGTGEFVPLSGLSFPKLREAIKRVLTEESYKQNATRLQQAIGRAGGVSRAADIVEQVVSTRKPVLSHVN